MKKVVLIFICTVMLFGCLGVSSNAETIFDIIPKESGLDFDEEAIKDDSENGLLEYTKFEYIFEFLLAGVKKYFPEFCKLTSSLLLIVAFFSLLDRLSYSVTSKNHQMVISCYCSAVMSLFLINCFTNACTIIENSLETIRVFCDASVPIISALLIEGGKGFSSAFFSYAISLCVILINSLNGQIFMPLIRILISVGCCGCIWTDVDFSSITDLIEKFIKWLIGIVFSVFTFTLSIQNILVRSADNSAQKILKNAAGGIPYIGGALSKGIDGAFLIACGAKNTSCIVGLIVILSVFSGPMLLLIMQSFALYIAVTFAKLFDQKDCRSILMTVHKAYLLMLSLFLVSILMCVICYFMICVGAN